MRVPRQTTTRQKDTAALIAIPPLIGPQSSQGEGRGSERKTRGRCAGTLVRELLSQTTIKIESQQHAHALLLNRYKSRSNDNLNLNLNSEDVTSLKTTINIFHGFSSGLSRAVAHVQTCRHAPASPQEEREINYLNDEYANRD